MARPGLTTTQRGRRWPRRRRPPGYTTAAGYGHTHQQIRLTYIAAFRPGQPCAIGGEELWHHTHLKWCDLLDLAHDHQHGGYLGLACRKHNRGEPSLRRLGMLTSAYVSAGRRW